jgi:hypothetical protein
MKMKKNDASNHETLVTKGIDFSGYLLHLQLATIRYVLEVFIFERKVLRSTSVGNIFLDLPKPF